MPAMQGTLTGVGGAYTFVNSEALAVVNGMTTAPDTSRRLAIDTLVSALKTGAISGTNIWNMLDFLQVYAAHDQQAARVNWKAPGTRDATETGTIVWTSDRGYSATVSGSYVDTGYNPTLHATNYALNSGFIGAWSRTSGTVAASALGYFDGTNGATLNFRNANGAAGVRLNQASVYNTANNTVSDGSGWFVGNRSASNAVLVRRNGTLVGSAGTTASSSVANGTMAVLSVTKSGTPAAVQVAAACAGGSLTANEHTDLYNALQAYMTAVGA